MRFSLFLEVTFFFWPGPSLFVWNFACLSLEISIQLFFFPFLFSCFYCSVDNWVVCIFIIIIIIIIIVCKFLQVWVDKCQSARHTTVCNNYTISYGSRDKTIRIWKMRNFLVECSYSSTWTVRRELLMAYSCNVKNSSISNNSLQH